VVTLAALSLPLQLPHHVLLLSAVTLRPAPAPPRPLPLRVPLPEPVLIAPPLPLPTLAVLVLSLSLPILPVAGLVLSLSLPILPTVAALLLLLPLLVIPVLLPAAAVAVLPRAGALRGALLVALVAAGGALLVAGTVDRRCGGLHRLLQVLVLVEVHGGRRLDRGSRAENLDGEVGERGKLNPRFEIGWLAFRIEKDWLFVRVLFCCYTDAGLYNKIKIYKLMMNIFNLK
jgi:hypothetical protein